MDDIIPQDIPLKQCSKCPNSYPATSDFFPKSGKDKLASHCKKCQSAYHKQYNETHKAQRSERGKQHYQAHRDEILEHQKQYQKAHKDKVHARTERYKVTRKEIEQERGRIRRQEETYQEYAKQYRESHKEDLLEYGKQYRRTERGRVKMRAHWHKREAQKRAIECTLTSQQIQDKLKAQRYRCYYCQKRFEKRNGLYMYHLEHTIPLSRIEHSPRHDVNYVVLACPTCNMRKHDKLPHEWPEGNRLF